MSKKPTRTRVVEKLDLDIDRIFDTPLPKVIKYLQEILSKHSEAYLVEEWSGYEDNYLEFQWWRDETDTELRGRQDQWEMVEDNRQRELKRRNKEKTLKDQIKVLERKLKANT